ILARPLDEISLLDVHQALGRPEMFAIGIAIDHPDCLVEQSVNAALTDAFDAAEQMLLSRFAEVKLSDIARDFDLRFRNLNEEPAQ
ncbi:Rrf2 family transcriptional regulator, partial [Mycobacterium tuberculosis]|nr:Rrf2 family transcriptional regulator [Mycobacterium tuberculosis]